MFSSPCILFLCITLSIQAEFQEGEHHCKFLRTTTTTSPRNNKFESVMTQSQEGENDENLIIGDMNKIKINKKIKKSSKDVHIKPEIQSNSDSNQS